MPTPCEEQREAKFIKFRNATDQHRLPEQTVRQIYSIGVPVYKRWIERLGIITPAVEKKQRLLEIKSRLDKDPRYNNKNKKATISHYALSKEYGVHSETIRKWMEADGIKRLEPPKERYDRDPLQDLINQWRR